MKNLIKICILLALTTFANLAFAQKSSEEKTKILLEKLNAKLLLSQEQQQLLSDIFIVHFNSVKDIRTQFKNKDIEQGKVALKEQWRRTDEQVISNLNEVQKPKYLAAKKELREALRKKLNNNKHKLGNAKLKPSKAEKQTDKEVENLIDDDAY